MLALSLKFLHPHTTVINLTGVSIFMYTKCQVYVLALNMLYSILSIKNGKDLLPIEDNCLEEERSDDSRNCLKSVKGLTFVMLMTFFVRLNLLKHVIESDLYKNCLHIYCQIARCYRNL